MDLPRNPFKAALLEKRLQVGLWSGLADAYCTEICATAGFDFLVLDCEHAPNDIRSVLSQLQAIAPYPVLAVALAASGSSTHI
jgi:4-hydroxy-2-oxoheptanedioate aldolase